MRWRTPRATVLGLCLVAPLAATAVAEPPEDEGARFTMSPVDGGFLRLDRHTGAVAMCARNEKNGGEWACRPVDDPAMSGRANRISHLEMENLELKGRIRELENLLESRPAGPPPLEGPTAEGPPGGKSQLPTDEEVDQALDYMSRVYKKIRDHIKDLDKPSLPDERAPPPPSPPTAPKGSL